MIRVLQANTNRSRTANDLLHQLVREKDVHLLLVTEQYQNKNTPSWYSDVLSTAAIWLPDPGKVVVRTHGRGRGFVWVTSEEITLFSCYLTPNERIQDFQSKLDALENEIINIKGCVVVAGDFNAKVLEWGIPKPDTRGRDVL